METQLIEINGKFNTQEATISRVVQTAVAQALEMERRRSEEALANTTTRLEERIDRFCTDQERLAVAERESNQKFREEIKVAVGGQRNRPPPIFPSILNLDAEHSQAQGQGENEVRTPVGRGWREGIGEEERFENRNGPGRGWRRWRRKPLETPKAGNAHFLGHRPGQLDIEG